MSVTFEGAQLQVDLLDPFAVTPVRLFRHPGGDWDEPPVHDEDQLYDTIDALIEIAEAHGASAAQVALAWLLGRPGVTTVIVGARTEEQLADNLKAADLVLSDDERSRLDQVSAQRLLYPHWHQAKTSGDRLSPADLSVLGPHLKG